MLPSFMFGYVGTCILQLFSSKTRRVFKSLVVYNQLEQGGGQDVLLPLQPSVIKVASPVFFKKYRGFF